VSEHEMMEITQKREKLFDEERFPLKTFNHHHRQQQPQLCTTAASYRFPNPIIKFNINGFDLFHYNSNGSSSIIIIIINNIGSENHLRQFYTHSSHSAQKYR
jgi:hypothetical protein